MKTPLLPAILAMLAAASVSKAQEPARVLLERGPHHYTLGRVRELRTPRGVRHLTNASLVVLQPGVHRWDAERGWVPASPRLELFQDGAVARGLQYSVSFGPNLAASGAIHLRLPTGENLTGSILGLAYTEGERSALIAQVKDSSGVIGGADSNVLTFENAFTDFYVSVEYRVELGRVSQSLLIHERLKPPTDPEYSLSEDAHLELITEWTTAPLPRTQTQIVEPAQGAQRALTDQHISFGSMALAPGKAFLLGQETAGVPVFKSWEPIRDETGNLRTFLVEKIPWRKIRAELQKLPPRQAQGNRSRGTNALIARASAPRNSAGAVGTSIAAAGTARALTWLPRPAQRPTLKPIQLAGSGPPLAAVNQPKALVWDWEAVLSVSNWTFRSDRAYLVTNAVYLTGTTTLEATAVKFQNSACQINQLEGQFICLTGPYSWATFTSKDDDSLAETIPGSTGQPAVFEGAGPLGGSYLYFGSLGGSDLHHLRFRYAHTAVAFDVDGAVNTLSHLQFVHGHYGVFADTTTIHLRNVLLDDVQTAVVGAVFNGTGEHLTVHQCNLLTEDGGYGILALTNSLLVNVTNFGSATVTTNYTAAVSSDAVFQSVGAGAMYLAASSPYRNAGTTNIDPNLLAELRKLTTYPPVILTNRLSVNTTLAPQAPRDQDGIDLGWHYEPIDVAVNTLDVSNVVLILTNGVALATYGDTGLWVHDGAQLISEGTPLTHNRLCRYTGVQEQATNWGGGSVSGFTAINSWHYLSRPSGRFRFTDFETVAGDGSFIYHGAENCEWTALTFRDCELGTGSLYLNDALSDTMIALTNNLFCGSAVYASGQGSLFGHNNLFQGANCTFFNLGTNVWALHDNAFEYCLLGSYEVSNSHTAYINMNDRLDPTNSTDQILTSLAWETGPLGRYYQPTNSPLLDAGSVTNAALVGFYHYATVATQAKEGTSPLDRGLHYVALGTNGLPADSDGDGLPDYLEDWTGEGVVGGGEPSWTNYTSSYRLLGSPGLQVFTPLK